MLTSRMFSAIKSTKLPNHPTRIKTSVRHSHNWYYRCGSTKPQKTAVYVAEGTQGFVWWWILWHLWTEPGHVIGEFPYPNASQWTDEELGIPPE